MGERLTPRWERAVVLLGTGETASWTTGWERGARRGGRGLCCWAGERWTTVALLVWREIHGFLNTQIYMKLDRSRKRSLDRKILRAQFIEQGEYFCVKTGQYGSSRLAPAH